MSTPVISPNGEVWDIPNEKVQDAIRNGGKVGIDVQGPDGNKWTVPAEKYGDAIKAGGQIIRLGQGEQQQPGFLSTLWDDLKQMPGAMLSTAGAALTPPGGTLVPGQLPSFRNPIAESLAQVATNYQQRQQAGNTLPYRLAAGAAEMTGTNVSGMEQAATAGNPAAVMGHAAAVPVAMAIAARAPAVARGALDARSAMRAGMAGPVPAAPVYPGASLPGTPAPELLQANALTQGGQPVIDPASGLARIPTRQAAVEPSPGQPSVQPGASDFGSQTPVSSPLHGESALSDLLSRLDNATLLRIAKSRGVNVSQLSQLKAGAANGRLLQAIVNDFSPSELSDISSQVLENQRFPRDFGQISDEAYRTMALQSYFPDLKIPATQLKRTAASIAGGKK